MFGISIHALREEGDTGIYNALKGTSDFYPRPPRGGRLHVFIFGLSVSVISIHALREEGDADVVKQRVNFLISIHALREEGDSKNRDKISIFL